MKPQSEKDITGSATAVEAKTEGKKGGKMGCIIAIVFLIVAVAVVVVLLLFVLPGSGGGSVKSKYYDVLQHDLFKDVILYPKKNEDDDLTNPVEHKNTLIWLHGRKGSAEKAAALFDQEFDGKRLTPDTTKIVIPQSLIDFKKTEEKDSKKDTGKNEEKSEDENENSTPDDDSTKEEEEDPEKKARKEKLAEEMPFAGKYKVLDEKYDQDQLSLQANIIIELFKKETEILQAGNSYSKTDNKVYIGGFEEGGVLALATYLKIDESKDS